MNFNDNNNNNNNNNNFSLVIIEELSFFNLIIIEADYELFFSFNLIIMEPVYELFSIEYNLNFWNQGMHYILHVLCSLVCLWPKTRHAA